MLVFDGNDVTSLPFCSSGPGTLEIGIPYLYWLELFFVAPFMGQLEELILCSTYSVGAKRGDIGTEESFDSGNS